MIRCCLCREVMHSVPDFETTKLPGSGWRCRDHDACHTRKQAIIRAHIALGEVCK